MRFTLLVVCVSTLFITSCGGGSEDSKTTEPKKTNNPPVIAPTTTYSDNSNDKVIETLESFTILLKITDIDNDVITGSVKIEEHIVGLSLYTGSDDFTHSAEFTIATKGEKTASINVSDGNNTEVTSSYIVSIIPNKKDVQTILAAEFTNFIMASELEDSALLGTNTDEKNRTIGYLSTALTDANIEHNASPAGECEVNTPHKFLSVDVTSNDVNLPEIGLIFPLECINESQNSKIQARIKKKTLANLKNVTANSYIAQNFAIQSNSETGISISQTGSGIRIEGAINDIICGDMVLSSIDNVYQISNEQITSNIDSLFSDSNNFTLLCHRTVEFEGELKTSPLLATITGELTETDSTSPTGSIDSVTFSIPHLDGGLDQGDICVETTAIDNNEVLSEVLTLHASDGLVEDVVMTIEEGTEKYCASLSGFDGGVHVTQTITDIANNEVSHSSETYVIEKNDAPVFSEQLANSIVLNTNQGVITLINTEDVSDPENHTVTLAGQTTIDTAQAAGNYNITATATDAYNAQTSKTIAVQLSDNSPPTAQMALAKQYIMIGDQIRDINESIELTLLSNDLDGVVVDSMLETSINNETYSEITNYSSRYIHNISAEGGNKRAFNYQVTDNLNLVSNVAHLEFDIHLNTPPIYNGQLTYSAERGECITVEQMATDDENDNFIFSIENDNWMICSNNIETIDRLVTIKDDYDFANTVTISANFTECPNTETWSDSACRLLDSIPNAFSFNSRTNAEFNTLYGSNIVTITGLETTASVSITGGKYSINDFAANANDTDKYKSANGTIKNGDRIHIIQTSANNEKTTTTARVNIGGIVGEFKVTTDSLYPEITTWPDKNYTSTGQQITGRATIESGVGDKNQGKATTYNWSQVSGPRSLTISQSEDLSYGKYYYPIQFTAPIVTEVEEYTFRFTATNAAGLSGFDEWKVTFYP